ncbi:MAG: hypothetical protein GEU74_12020 [Nitriliruptorales bacterium]|nr:hypothetical protein [Nitriliruptorales bacterium]
MPTDKGASQERIPTDDSPVPTGATAVTSPRAAETSRDDEATGRIPLDLVGGVFLLAVAAVFVLNAGEEMLDWIFPLSLSYALGIIGVYLTIRGLLGFGPRTDTLLPVLRRKGVDVFVFSALTAAYVGLARSIGFWIMSIVMLFGGAVYLDHARTKTRVAVAAGIAVAVCLVAYVLLRRVFYVPLPRALWLPF